MLKAAKSGFVFVFLCFAAHAHADCNPGPDQAAFFTDANFQGSCVLRGVGLYPTATDTGLPNDSISSIRVGGNIQVYACQDENFGGTCVVLPADIPFLGDTDLGNDALTSAKVQPFEHNFDARCSNRTGTGRFVCTINKPIVTRPEWVYSQIAFAPGDVVYVGGDGCVQTGGSGGTWKRYINPSGSNADHFYHGLVRIPGGRQAGTDVGNSLTRIEHVAGRPITVAGDAASPGDLELHLGYEDDNFDDNGYNNHDDGTEDQCKTSGTNYGGSAFVIVTICRGVSPCEAPESRFPFNVRSSQYDPNGFLYNPHWAWQERPENRSMSPVPTPNTLLCHGFTKGGPLLALHFYDEPNLPDCTDQAGTDTLNQPSDFSPYNIACTIGIVPGGFSGHINWFPITVTGSSGRISHEGKDDDWTFSFASADTTQGSLYYDHPDERRRILHSEFDSDETVDHFRSDAWSSLHKAIDERERISDQLHACQSSARLNCTDLQAASDAAWAFSDQLFIGDAIVTGLFGIDGEHGEKSELHPVYALATNPCVQGNYVHNHCTTENDPGDDAWLMFVRNRGDEGACSDQIMSAGFDDYTFRLPWRDGMQSATVNWDKSQFHWSDDGSDRPDVKIVPPIFVHTSAIEQNRPKFPFPETPGVYVTFHLRYPTVISASDSSASIPFVDGALHLIWIPEDPNVPPPHFGPRSAALVGERADTEADADDEDALDVALSHLPEAKRKQVISARGNLSPESYRRPGPTARGADRSIGIVAVRNGSPVAGPVGPATRKNRRDEALFKALCAATHNKPQGLPATVCIDKTRRHAQ